jgi:hypothetical protein
MTPDLCAALTGMGASLKLEQVMRDAVVIVSEG